MDGQNWLSLFLYACVTALSVALARAGLAARVKTLEVEVNAQNVALDALRVDTDLRMKQQREEFRSEVETIVKPLRNSIEEQRKDIGQIKTMMSTLINRQAAGQ